MTAGELYFPVPTMRRDEKVLSAIVKMSMVADLSSPAADEIDDLDAIAVLDDGVRVPRAPEHRQIVLDCDAARIDLEAAEQLADGERPGQLDAIPVDRDLQSILDSSV